MTLLTFDYLILNRDRHLSNIELIKSTETNTWRFAPIFDCGQSFLSKDRIQSNFEMEKLIRKYKSKPFSSNPDKNLINIQLAQNICKIMVKNIEKNGGLDSADIKEFHKKIFLYRVRQLLSKST